MSGTFTIVPRYCIESGEVSGVGEMIGLDWNDVCDLVSRAGLYGEDGAGYTTVQKGQTFGNDLDLIFTKIFEDNPSADEIYILDDF
ncbi:hypothetical protein pEaSNUABM50_00428 [Erwinia phage pEa_SNUABM_50]|uniref:Uncharacterized protein n=4 Tax=Eneladusvirus BF TaxID=2560751 RepID=A0A7L8ZN38_9CAUD|nr:hypothetical protein FDH34_gp496 [Serratia phage BF]QOI71363.1 hypothetical protein pEaSNUABM12_00434 [Erwinia phage pEa_SNUABM_12]QOI71905.1 hypothetical protein pEaSNUABM47_00430 [Erwinia phage pEa_SNUABM_47]QOI72444.1 hypothetical protein pEaSNUABM50_00428 [Erwinia phage pEa_SNUABM_50]QXO11571.1 hypothetical protein pEaSNUABM19_00434 [Erwinia phage pEa_SNUABM_19]QXO12119.1 hypothetical protein pEaSNUABM44_00432 [Erwinia phage pEa_SNUABM_44]QXO12672.1 hypothetical protein pEaSNUABM49_004